MRSILVITIVVIFGFGNWLIYSFWLWVDIFVN